ncbi:MAG TPA: hypothetical protein VFS08_01595 [Gemmatimonadaceae bacterium]|nr:hypothetical protein [Gemmatimonadaceae bacterium]
MALHGAEGHVVGYTPARTNRGWGVALFICLLTASLWTMAWLVNRNTYENPRDPLSPGSEQSMEERGGHAQGAEPAQGGAPEHGAAPAPGEAPAGH